jgi:hypothetical protein
MFKFASSPRSFCPRLVPHLHHIQPLQRKRRHDPTPVPHRRHVQVRPVIPQRVPHVWKRRRDHMQHVHALADKWQMVVAHRRVRARRAIRVWQKRRRGRRFKKPESPHARLDAGERLVGPVRGGEVGRDVRVRGAEEVEEQEEGYLGEGVAVFVEFRGGGVG